MMVKTLQDAIQYFSDEQVCIDAVARMRWPDGKPHCPACNSLDHYWLATQKRWKCKECWKQFSVKVGTIFEDSPLSLTKWLPALWMIVNCKNGISSYEIARDLGVSQKSAWFMLHRLRLVMKNRTIGKLGGGTPETEVEVDETFVGGKARNMHRERRLRYEQSGGHHGKTVVVGMFDRENRKIRTKIVPNVKRETLQDEILKNVKHGSAIYTDNAVAYDNLHWRYVHDVVNHAERYVKGRVHTNSLENFWSLLKRNLRGTYVAVEPFHLERYVDEQVFRFNNRGDKNNVVTDADRFNLALSQVGHKRLTFAEVIGKDGTTPF
jgi:transposase-like protein